MQGRDMEARRVGTAGREVTQRTWRLDARPAPPMSRPRRPRRRDHTVPLYGAQADLAAILPPAKPAATPEQPQAATQDHPTPGPTPEAVLAAAVAVAPERKEPPAPPARTPPTRTPSAAARRRAIRQAGGVVVSRAEPVASAPAVPLPPLSPHRSLAHRSREGIAMRFLRRVLTWLGLA